MSTETKVNIDLEENSLAKRIATFLEKLNINRDVKEISLDKCIKIIGEIRKAVNESKDIAITLKNIEPSEKAQKIYEITIELLSTSVIKDKLSPEVNTQIKKYIDNKELVETIGELVEWGSDMILDSYDNNKDGIVTIDEISDDVVSCCMCKTNRNPEGCACYRQNGCCGCCAKCSKSFGLCWGKFFTNILCCGCGSNKIKYKN